MFKTIIISIIGLYAVVATAEELTITQGNWQIEQGKEREQTLQVTDYSPAVGKVLEITASPSRFGYTTLHPAAPLELASEISAFNGNLSFSIFCDNVKILHKAAVRMEDASGEIFQAQIIVRNLRPGQWNQIGFLLCPATQIRDHWYPWGGNKDGKLDFPIKLRGFTFDYDPSFQGKLRIMLTDFKWQKINTAK